MMLRFLSDRIFCLKSDICSSFCLGPRSSSSSSSTSNVGLKVGSDSSNILGRHYCLA